MTHLKAKHEAPHMTPSVKLLQKFVRNLSQVLQGLNAKKLSQITTEHLFKQSKSEKITFSLKHSLKCRSRHKIPHNSRSFVCPAK